MTNFNNDQEKLAQIDLFLKGNLSGKTKTSFEQKLSTDKEFAAEVEQYITAANLVKEYGIYEELKSVHNKFMEEKESIVVPIFPRMKYIAAVLVLILSGILVQASLINKQNILDNQQLFNYQARNAEESDLNALLNSYHEGDFESVIEQFNQSPAYGNNAKANFYAGNAFLGLNKPEEAKNCFIKVIQDNSSNLSENAEWYLALSELKSEHYDQALALFEKIKDNEDHLYNDQISNWQIIKLRILKIKG
ncbi:tetratricopeptide repeat protein [Flexithrix dorotheae]|uniref:tetratricopeptide repeat protein n=1 Tax=Flexithrix dorotheae TaxID=70993 RepID=UPI000376C2E9|nr:hypothetical protein [Flexithrix dorotheae]